MAICDLEKAVTQIYNMMSTKEGAMIILAKLIGFVIVTMGLIIALNPDTFKAVINFWKQGKNLYVAGAMRLAFGVIFIMVAPECRLSWFISVMGILMIIGGIVLFAIGPKRILAIFDWWEKKPLLLIRVIGLMALALGGFILYSI